MERVAVAEVDDAAIRLQRLLEGVMSTGQGGRHAECLDIPVSIRYWGEEGPGGQHVHRLERIIDRLVVIHSTYPFKQGQILCLELCVSDAIWQDRMRVVQVAPLARGWRMHLESTTQIPAHPSQADRDLPDPTRRFQAALRERDWIENARSDFQRVSQAYLRARRWWGLLGTSPRREIARVIAALPGTAAPRVPGERRRQRRRFTHGRTQFIVHSPLTWRLLDGEMVDVSRSGLRLLVGDADEGRSFEDTPVITRGTPVVVGLGEGSERLWVPAEIVRVDAPVGKCFVGLQFVTLRALQAFSG